MYKPASNGVVNVVLGLKNELNRMGNDARVLSPSPSNDSYRDGDEYFIKSHRVIVYPDARLSAVRHDPLLDELRDWAPDIMHLHTEFSTARMARSIGSPTDAPFVMTVHTDYATFLFGKHGSATPVRAVQTAWSAVAFKGARAIIAPSEKAAEQARSYAVDCPVVVIPNGINLSLYQQRLSGDERARLLAELGLHDNHQVLVSVSRVSREKRVKDLISYFPAVREANPEAQLLIVGDGPALKKLKAYASELGVDDAVRFSGGIPIDEVWAYYALGDVFVSSSDFEMHSMAYLEAMARGLPLVCRDDLCLKGVLEEGVNGHAFTTEEEYVEHTTRLLRDEELRARMSAASLGRAAQFTDEANAKRTLELYRQVLEGEI